MTQTHRYHGEKAGSHVLRRPVAFLQFGRESRAKPAQGTHRLEKVSFFCRVGGVLRNERGRKEHKGSRAYFRVCREVLMLSHLSYELVSKVSEANAAKRTLRSEQRGAISREPKGRWVIPPNFIKLMVMNFCIDKFNSL